MRVDKPLLNRDGGRYKYREYLTLFLSHVFERSVNPSLSYQSPDGSQRIDEKIQIPQIIVWKSKYKIIISPVDIFNSKISVSGSFGQVL